MPVTPSHGENASFQPTAVDALLPVFRRLRMVLGGSLLAAGIAYAVTYAIAPTFTARTSFLPPQQQQSTAASALSSLGALAGLTGGGMPKTPADQYVALLQSTTLTDRIIDQFKLQEVYDEKYRVDTRRQLDRHVRVAVGKKDGIIVVEVDDKDPQRAADMANRHVAELRRLNDELALSEAKQRRVFFEGKLRETRDKLTEAQQALEASGIGVGSLKAEPKAAAEGYAKLRAELTSAEVRLQTLRRTLAENSPEVQQQAATVSALRGQLAQLEQAASSDQRNSDYVGKYREFKYQEAVFELLARQYEGARLDEAREGALIQVIDRANPPEKKSKPQRVVTALIAFVAALFLLSVYAIVRDSIRDAERLGNRSPWFRLRTALNKD